MFYTLLFFPRAGGINYYTDSNNRSPGGIGDYGGYWSPTINGNYAHILYFYDSTVNPSGSGYGSYRYSGLPVRCLVN